MKLKLIGLRSFFILCLTLKGRKVGVCASYGKLVDSTLNLIGVESPVKDVAEWQRAFILLSSEYELMKNNLTKEYEIMENNLTKDYEIMENNLTNAHNALSKDYEIMKNNLTKECDKWKDEYLKLASVEFTRRILEDGDSTLTYGGFAFPKVNDMKNKLKKDKGQLDETAVSEAKNLEDYESKRRIRWLYYITYAETTFAEDIRKLLDTWKISAFTLSGCFDRIFEISCGKIHGFSVNTLDVKTAEAGFQMYGVFDKGLLDCLTIIFELPKLTGFNPPTTTTTVLDQVQKNEQEE